MKRAMLKAAAFAAAVTLTVGSSVFLPERLQPAVTMNSYAEEEYTEGAISGLTYYKYSDHIEINGSDLSATSVEIPSSIDGLPVTEIGSSAFMCSSIKSVKIPDTVTVIGNYAFNMCFNLTSVTIPESVEKIGIRAFEMCSSLSEVKFPDRLIEMNSKVFDSTPWMTEQRKKNPLVIVNGALIDGDSCEGKVEIPSSVKYVSSSTFARNTKVTSVVFPASVTKINDNTFFYCENLTSVEAVSAEFIGSMAFDSCTKLTNLKLSNKLKKIDGYAFADVTSNATITFCGKKSEWESVDKPAEDAFLKRATMIFDESYTGPEEIMGDVNADGTFDIADVVLFQKWLLRKPGVKLADWKAADFTKDEKLNVFDLCLMKREYVSKK